MNIFREITLLLSKSLVDYHRYIVVNNHIFPNVRLSLVNLHIIDAFCLSLLTLKHLLQQIVLVGNCVEDIG